MSSISRKQDVLDPILRYAPLIDSIWGGLRVDHFISITGQQSYDSLLDGWKNSLVLEGISTRAFEKWNAGSNPSLWPFSAFDNNGPVGWVNNSWVNNKVATFPSIFVEVIQDVYSNESDSLPSISPQGQV